MVCAVGAEEAEWRLTQFSHNASTNCNSFANDSALSVNYISIDCTWQPSGAKKDAKDFPELKINAFLSMEKKKRKKRILKDTVV